MAVIKIPPAVLVLLDISASQTVARTVPRNITFQYEPTEVQQDISSAWASVMGLGRANPILQYSGGEEQRITFTARLWAPDSDQSIDAQLDELKAATQRVEELGRPPRWQFIWGSAIDATVVVRSIGNIVYDQMRPDGSVRGATCSIVMSVAVDTDIGLVAEDRPTDTFYAATRVGEQWEDIAGREYGDALLGVILRNRNPSVPFPGAVPGTVVKLPKFENIRNETIEPTSIPLQRTTAGMALRSAVLALHSVTRDTAVLKR